MAEEDKKWLLSNILSSDSIQSSLESVFVAKEEKKSLLGEKLVEAGLITPEELEIALKEQRRTGELLGEVLVRLGFVDEDQLASALYKQKGVEKVDINSCLIDLELLALIPKELAAKYKIIPVSLENGELTLAMVNPFDVEAIDFVTKLTGKKIKPVGISEAEFEEAFPRYYGKAKSIDNIVEELVSERITPGEADTRIVQLVDYILLKSAREKATDVHIEPAEEVLRVRYRIDGVMSLGFILPKKLHSAITTRIKLISGLNISETRQPQDGRTTFKYGNKEVDLRVSSLPTIYGEAIVMRLLGLTKAIPRLSTLGLSEHSYNLLIKVIREPYGIFLITGPTGSGKTTTLYACLNEVYSVQKTIITVEDPVEYKWELIRQVQINVRAGLTFAKALRSILRQDPDIVLIGEIRDEETADIAVRAAQTGHLVLTTLHTNDAPSSIARLVDLGVRPYLVGDALLAVSAQRLVRKICPGCRVEYEATPEEKEYLGVPMDERLILARGNGCDRCRFTGYLGRTAVSEMLVVDDDIKYLISSGATTVEIRRKAVEKGFRTLFEDARDKVISRVTTIDEMRRVIG